ncbi:MAG TPA: hypothetical protein VN814_05200 [Caulobacteraceae bacterium]|nr:hypothetical protein [Caulobacteraceae bacterium]
MRWGQEHHAERALAARRRPARRSRALGIAAASIAGHLVVGLALFAAWAKPEPPAYDPPAMTVALVTLPPPAVDPTPPTPAKTAPAAAHAQRSFVRPTPRPAPAASLAAAETGQSADVARGLSNAALAGAATAASGGGDGGCNMARRLEQDLGHDRLVQSAVSGFAGKAVLVWNGDWVWIDGEDGKGLTAVRQAMMWDIAFSPQACRAQPMHGLVVIAANGGARLVVGSGAWRWSDLLVPHPGAGAR